MTEQTQDKQNEGKLALLIVEDDSKHLADAKRYFQDQNERGAKIVAHYATNYVEAKEQLDTQQFDGIISDIFFPYDSQGRSQFVANECARVLSEKTDLDFILNSKPEIRASFEAWHTGEAMHPAGLLVGEYAISKNLPFVFCSDTYHHGASAQPICMYSRQVGSVVLDGNMETCFNKLDGKLPADPHCLEKTWSSAYAGLLYLIGAKFGEATEFIDKFYRENKK